MICLSKLGAILFATVACTSNSARDGKLLAVSTCVAINGHHGQTQVAIIFEKLSLSTLLAPCKGKVSMLDGPFGCTEEARLVAPPFSDFRCVGMHFTSRRARVPIVPLSSTHAPFARHVAHPRSHHRHLHPPRTRASFLLPPHVAPPPLFLVRLLRRRVRGGTLPRATPARVARVLWCGARRAKLASTWPCSARIGSRFQTDSCCACCRKRAKKKAPRRVPIRCVQPRRCVDDGAPWPRPSASKTRRGAVRSAPEERRAAQTSSCRARARLLAAWKARVAARGETWRATAARRTPPLRVRKRLRAHVRRTCAKQERKRRRRKARSAAKRPRPPRRGARAKTKAKKACRCRARPSPCHARHGWTWCWNVREHVRRSRWNAKTDGCARSWRSFVVRRTDDGPFAHRSPARHETHVARAFAHVWLHPSAYADVVGREGREKNESQGMGRNEPMLDPLTWTRWTRPSWPHRPDRWR